MSKIVLGDDGATVYIQCEIKSQELFEALQDVEDDKRLEVFVDIVKIGVTGYRRMNIGVNLDFVEKKIDEMLSKLEQKLDPYLETSLLGIFISRIKEYFDRGRKIEDILDPETENTPLGKFVRSIKEYFDSGGKLENLLNPDSETSPIGRFNKKLEEYLDRGGRLEELLNPAEDDSPILDRTEYPLHRSNFEKAYEMVPIKGPGVINNIVRGPAYVWARLHDRRISREEW